MPDFDENGYQLTISNLNYIYFNLVQMYAQLKKMGKLFSWAYKHISINISQKKKPFQCEIIGNPHHGTSHVSLCYL